MKIRLLIGILFISVACSESDKNQKSEKEELTFEKKQIALERIGKIYYERNCIQCHAKKGVKDQILEYAIKSDRYEFEFLKAYLTNQDSLIKNGNETALELKERWNDQTYLHDFELNDKEVKAIIYYLKK